MRAMCKVGLGQRPGLRSGQRGGQGRGQGLSGQDDRAVGLYSYMNDTQCMLTFWTKTAAKDFGEPSWNSDESIYPVHRKARP